VHVIGPELGATLPGMTVVCGDSHTSTHGALGALAVGIGTSEVEHVLATQTLLAKKASNLLVRIEGRLGPGIGAKDVCAGADRSHRDRWCDRVRDRIRGRHRSHAVGRIQDDVVQHVDRGWRACRHWSRWTRSPSTTLRGRPFAPTGSQWDAAQAHWRNLHSDPGAHFDRVVPVDASQIEPQVSWGTSPEMVSAIGGLIPDPARESDPARRAGIERALQYMGLTPGLPITDIRIDKVFIGSCTNSRIEDLREAARVVRGRRIAPSVRQALVVPGSGRVKAQAEAEGLDRVFLQAGFEWREPGCSMCLGMNDDRLEAGERCASTSNRNFEGRQGAGGRTHLVSPAMAAAAALAGRFVDVRQIQYMQPFIRHTGLAVALDRANVDTDQIIPKQFLKSIRRRGFGVNLFDEWRYLDRGHPGQDPAERRANPNFVLNLPRGTGARRSCWQGAISDAAPVASTRPGLCRSSDFGP